MKKFWIIVLIFTLILSFLKLFGFEYIYDRTGSSIILFLIMGLSISMLLTRYKRWLITFILLWIGLGLFSSSVWFFNNMMTPTGYKKINEEGRWKDKFPPYYIKAINGEGATGLHDPDTSVRMIVYERKFGPIYKTIDSFRTQTGTYHSAGDMTPSQLEEFLEHRNDYNTYGERRKR